MNTACEHTDRTYTHTQTMMAKTLAAVFTAAVLCAPGTEAANYYLSMPCQAQPSYYFTQNMYLSAPSTIVTGLQLTLAPWGTGCTYTHTQTKMTAKTLAAVFTAAVLCAPGTEAANYYLSMPCQAQPSYYFTQNMYLSAPSTIVTGLQLTLAPWGTGCNAEPVAWKVELCGSRCTDVTSHFDNTVYGTQAAALSLYIDQSPMKLNFYPYNYKKDYCGVSVIGTVTTTEALEGAAPPKVTGTAAVAGNATAEAGRPRGPLGTEGRVTSLGTFSGYGHVQAEGSGSYVYWTYPTTETTPVGGITLALGAWGIGCAASPTFALELCYNSNTNCVDLTTRFQQTYGSQYAPVGVSFPGGGLALRMYNKNYNAQWCGLNTSFVMQ
eukprot:TRINITY_DN8961_c0_g1_i1.p2 TRINITY_DN8961_c0_g1~~TRINITY_DN8961_c0_g1_i1.p2  ORF type:complete len:380 (+),score=135.91 TRINITY_DN8961_c0_g1_i1:1519-2658(+)